MHLLGAETRRESRQEDYELKKKGEEVFTAEVGVLL